MRDFMAGMVDAMLLENTTPEQIAEIGRMAEEGAAPPTPDDDPAPPNPEEASFVKEWLRSITMAQVEKKRQPPPTIEQDPKPTPEPGPIRHARKEAELPVLAPPLTVDEVKSAADPKPIVMHVHLPPVQESKAMMKLAEAMGKQAESMGKSLERMADNASKPQEPARVHIAKGAVQVTTPPVTIAKGAVNVDVAASKPANVKIDNHVHVPKVKGIERDKDGNMVKPVYEE